MKLLIYSILIFISFSAFADDLDTVNIFISKSDIPYKKLKRIWFPGEGTLTYSYSSLNQQDQIITNDTSYYFKVYNRTKCLILEGRKTNFNYLSGLVKFYYSNGLIKRTEFYKTDSDSGDSAIVMGGDGAHPWGKWEYYNKKGQIKKTIVYSVEKSEDKKELCEVITTTTFGRNNKVKYKQSLKKECRPSNGT